MKNLKSKLLASVAMLVISGVMLTSASFAWFTISTAPEISNIQTTVTSNGNLEIILDNGFTYVSDANTTIPKSTNDDGGKNETWGNLVDLNDYFTADATKVELKPMDVNEANGEVKAPKWGKDGRVDGLSTAISGTKVTAPNFGGIYTYADNSGKVAAVRVDFWLRSNVGGDVVLQGTAGTDRGAGETGLGSTLTGAMSEKVKVAFQIPTGGDSGDALSVATATVSDDTKKVYTLSTDGAICSLEENKPKKVSMYLYMDGEDLDNADFENTASNLALNVQFVLKDKPLDAMDITATADNGRTGATAGDNPESGDPVES